MRKLIIALSMLIFSTTSALAQVSIGINISLFPDLVRVPSYPVYYAPRLGINFFFYDGLYWVYEDDRWYSSAWYNGPWMFVGPEYVPLFVLRIPVRYYVRPPPYFGRWSRDRPPRWDEHWGRDWEQRRSGWDRWERRSVPAPAPLPTYQKKYSGERYPAVEQQQVLHSRNYRYQPREAIVPQAGRAPATQRAPDAREPSASTVPRTGRQPDSAPATEQRQPRQSAPAPQADRPARGNDDVRRPAPDETQSRPRGPAVDDQQPPPRQSAPTPQADRPAKRDNDGRRPAPDEAQPRSRGPAVDERMPQQQGPAERQQPAPKVRQDDRHPGPGPAPEPRRGQGPEKDRESGPERGQGRER